MAIITKNENTYDRSTAVQNYKGPKFNMSRLIRSDLGNGKYSYRTADGTIVSDSSGKLTKNAWNYLASKYGKDYANRTSANMLSGNIWQNGKWRPDYKASGNKTVDFQTAIKGQDMKTFNKSFLTSGKKNLAYNGVLGKLTDSKEEGFDLGLGFTGNALKWITRQTGYKLDDTAATVGSLGLYMIPGVGNALSAADAVDAARRGEWGEAALNTVFALPGIGLLGKLIKGGYKLTRAGKLVNKIVNTAKTYLQNAARARAIAKSATNKGMAAAEHNATSLFNKSRQTATKFTNKTNRLQNNAINSILNAKLLRNNSKVWNSAQKMQNFGNNKWIGRVGMGAGAGILAYNAPDLYNVGKIKYKDWRYGDDYDNYTIDDRKNDYLSLAKTDAEKEEINNSFDDAITNAMYANNDFGYDYDA